MEEKKCPQIGNLTEISPEQAREYIEFVAHVRFMQRRYFAQRRPEVLEECRRLEKELDTLNAELLDPTPRLF